MNYDEETCDKITKNFGLLSNIIRPKGQKETFRVDLSLIDKIINTTIPETLGKNAPDDFYEVYVDFKAEYERFKDFILYEKLIGKNIIALGGGFSSGKSSFLNALMGKKVLPADIDPSTSVPTFIVQDEKHNVVGINIFDAVVSMEPKDIRKIAHGFGEVENEDGETVTNNVTLGHVLENIFFSTPLHRYKNLAFLDTPGYSKPDSEKYSAKTDEQISRGQLNSSNYILWFVQADAGTITEEDIKFIKTLREDIPKLIVLNKADKKNIDDLKNIIEKIKDTLDIKGVRYEDVLAFSCKHDQIDDEELERFLWEQADILQKQIKSWNQEVYESNFARNFKVLFVRCKDFYDKEIDDEGSNLTSLNTAILKLSAEDVPQNIIFSLQGMATKVRNRISELEDIKKELKNIQDEFFKELKQVADIVGIDMPEPSEIDLLQDKIKNPMKVLEAYKKENHINGSSIDADVILAVLHGVETSLQKNLGGTGYKDELAKVIKANCAIKPQDIHINDCYKDVSVDAVRNLIKSLNALVQKEGQLQ